MMKAEEIIIPGIAGTTFMTLFSKAMGEIANENFSEPDLLSKLYHRLAPAEPKPVAKLAGWLGHYAIGLMFSTVYNTLWGKKLVKASGKNSIWLGAASGALAVGVWKSAFTMHPIPPGINFKKYYTQLLFAHIVFAMFATFAYQQIKKRELEQQQRTEDQKYLSNVKP
ncbi:hypothetical protein GCM10027049_22300 [Mucilaginibacter puniceus]